MPPEFSGGICFWSFAILALNDRFETALTNAALRINGHKLHKTCRPTEVADKELAYCCGCERFPKSAIGCAIVQAGCWMTGSRGA